jgi:hypothetical protein
MRAAKPLAALMAATVAFGTVSAVAPARLARSDVTNIHLVNVSGFKTRYVRAVKADVMNAYRGNVTPIQFSTRGHAVYFENAPDRLSDANVAFYGDWADCFHSDRGADPDAIVTADGVEAHDSAVVTLAVSEIINGHCSP